MLQESGKRRGFLRFAMLRSGNGDLLLRHEDEGGSSPPPPQAVLLSAFNCRRDAARHRSASCASKGASRRLAPHTTKAAPEPSRLERERERETVDGEATGRDKKEEKKRKKKRKEKGKKRGEKRNKKGIILFIFRNYDSQILFCLLLLCNEK
jgi:hypothetical protein